MYEQIIVESEVMDWNFDKYSDQSAHVKQENILFYSKLFTH